MNQGLSNKYFKIDVSATTYCAKRAFNFQGCLSWSVFDIEIWIEAPIFLDGADNISRRSRYFQFLFKF